MSDNAEERMNLDYFADGKCVQLVAETLIRTAAFGCALGFVLLRMLGSLSESLVGFHTILIEINVSELACHIPLAKLPFVAWSHRVPFNGNGILTIADAKDKGNADGWDRSRPIECLPVDH